MIYHPKTVWTKYMAATPNITAILLSSPNQTYPESCFAHVQPKPDSEDSSRSEESKHSMAWFLTRPQFDTCQIPLSVCL